MPQSLDKVLIHIVFSTKYRAPVLVRPIRPALHAYLAIRLSRMVTIANLVEEVKTSSSKWLKIQSPDLECFRWQRGYGVFSVNPKGQDDLCDYIDNQEGHHREQGFQEEYLEALAKEGIEYDERYVWD